MKLEKIVFSQHAITRMLQRDISKEEVQLVIEKNDVLEAYEDDQPFPSWLILGSAFGRFLHVVIGRDYQSRVGYVITVYVPSLSKWKPGFRERILQ
jgi:hypothetical protein